MKMAHPRERFVPMNQESIDLQQQRINMRQRLPKAAGVWHLALRVCALVASIILLVFIVYFTAVFKKTYPVAYLAVRISWMRWLATLRGLIQCSGDMGYISRHCRDCRAFKHNAFHSAHALKHNSDARYFLIPLDCSRSCRQFVSEPRRVWVWTRSKPIGAEQARQCVVLGLHMGWMCCFVSIITCRRN